MNDDWIAKKRRHDYNGVPQNRQSYKLARFGFGDTFQVVWNEKKN